MAPAAPSRPPCAVVIGGGIAGCAAAVALAGHGLPVVLLEAARHLGGVAVQGEHRTLCGLAPIDAPAATLLEAQLVEPWLPHLATGAPSRRGRVWLWPTTAATLATGLARRLAEQAVAVRLGWRLTALECAGGAGITRAHASDGAATDSFPVAAVIDASGRGASAACLGYELAPARQWPAHRSVLRLEAGQRARLAQRAGRQALFARIQAVAAAAAAFDLTPMNAAGELWQLSLDVAPGSSPGHAAAAAAAIARALEAELVACACTLGERDAGRPAGGLTLDELFACRERGLCWAAWPAEMHRQGGVDWRWPAGDRHGVPEAATRLRQGPANLWLIGKGMAVAPEAAAALRVTGTCLALGAAVAGAVAAAVAGHPAP